MKQGCGLGPEKNAGKKRYEDFKVIHTKSYFFISAPSCLFVTFSGNPTSNTIADGEKEPGNVGSSGDLFGISGRIVRNRTVDRN